MPFLRNVTRGRGVPDERLVDVAAHYRQRGGRSPINDQNRALLAALRSELDRSGLPGVALYWGNRNWHPLLADTVADMGRHGVERAAAFVTSAFSSYSGCRQYQEDIAAARATVGPAAPAIDKLRPFYDHPGFVEPVTALTRQARRELPGAHLVFCAHSIPTAAALTCDYEAQLSEVAALVAGDVDGAEWSLAFQSRSGPPTASWLEPDVKDHLEALARAGTSSVLLVPLGFVSDHMEVVHDLDTEALGTAARLGLRAARVPTVGTDARFVAMVVELFEERSAVARGEQIPRPSVAAGGPRPDPCAEGCCPAPGRPVTLSEPVPSRPQHPPQP